MSFPLFIVCTVLISAALIFNVAAVIAGKVKLSHALRPVEYYPPRGYSPIDVLIKYYGKFADPHSMFNPLMLYWASRGFITIEEDCKRGLKLTKLKPLTPPDAIADTYDNKTKRRKKSDKRSAMPFTQCDADKKECLRNFELEKKLFDKLFFAKSDDVFYTLAATSDYNNTFDEFMSECKKNAKLQNSSNSKKTEVFANLSAMAALIFGTLACAIASHDPIFLAMIFPIVGIIAIRFIPAKEMLYIKYPFFAVWAGAPFGVVIAFGPHGGYIFVIAYAVITAFVCVNCLATHIDIRTDRNVDIYGRICSFKTFLLQAELDKLETLVEEDPNYFYDILPYCYILKITDKLKPKFDRIAMDGPSWYLGSLRDTLMF